jgi:hypothetical protein
MSAATSSVAAAVVDNNSVTELTDTDDGNLVLERLKELGLPQRTYAHKQLFTVDEQSDEIDSQISGAMTKNLFLKDKKAGLFLVTCLQNRKVDIKALSIMLGLKPGKMSFANEQLLNSVLGVPKGSVTAFAMMNDKEKKVKFCIDKSLMDADLINAHPLRNDRTTSVSPDVLRGFMNSCDVEITVLDFDKKGEAGEDAAA